MSCRLYKWNEIVCQKDYIYKLQSKTIYCIPKFEKIVVNLSNNDAINDPKQMLVCLTAIELLTNQKPVIYRSTKSRSEFKLKKNSIIGVKVLLRNDSIFQFLDTFIFMYLPKFSNNKGLIHNMYSKSIKSISFGIKNLILFPQLNQSVRFKKILGCTFTILMRQPTKSTSLVLSEYQLPQKFN